MQFIEDHQATSHNLLSANEILVRLFANIQNVKNGLHYVDKHHIIGVLLDGGSCGSTFDHSSGTDRTACWIPIDIFMEKAMDEKHVHTGSAIEVLTGDYFNAFCYLHNCMKTSIPWYNLFSSQMQN